MSDFYGGPSAQSIENVGKSVASATQMIFDKLNNYEAQQQYLTAYQALREGMGKFNAQLQFDPNWQDYMNKTKSNDQKLYDQIMGKISNPQAKNMFQQQYVDASTSHYQQVSNMMVEKRMGNLWGQIESGIEGTITDTTLTDDQKKKQLKMFQDQSSIFPAWQQGEVSRQIASAERQIDVATTYRGAYQVLSATGDFSKAETFINEQPLNETEKSTTIRALHAQYTRDQQELANKLKANDEQNYLKDLDSIDAGKFNFNAFVESAGGFKSATAATYYKQVADYYRSRLNGTTAKVSSPNVYNDMSSLADDNNVSQADKISQITQAAIDGSLSLSDYGKLKDRARTATLGAFSTAMAQLKKYTTASATPPGSNKPWNDEEEQQAQSMLTDLKSQANLQNWTPSQILSEVDKITQAVNDQALNRAVKDSFTEKASAGLLGTGLFGHPEKPNEGQIADFLNSVKQGELQGLESTNFMKNAWGSLKKEIGDDIAKRYNLKGGMNARMQLNPDGTVFVQLSDGRIIKVGTDGNSLTFQEAGK